jgi:hypothetical protein
MTEEERRERNPSCNARQLSDEMACLSCRLRWDVNDPEPPPCKPIPADPMQPAENVRVHPRWKTWRGFR